MLAASLQTVVDAVVDNPIAVCNIPGIVRLGALADAECFLKRVEARWQTVIVIADEAFVIPRTLIVWGCWLEYDVPAVDLVAPEIITIIVRIGSGRPACT